MTWRVILLSIHGKVQPLLQVAGHFRGDSIPLLMTFRLITLARYDQWAPSLVYQDAVHLVAGPGSFSVTYGSRGGAGQSTDRPSGVLIS